MKINFSEQKDRAISIGEELFNKIIKFPGRSDQERTGVQLLLSEVGTKNLLLVPIYSPSDEDSSWMIDIAEMSEDLDRFSSEDIGLVDAGSVIVIIGNKMYLASALGLKPEDNVFFAIRMLSYLLEVTFDWTIANIKENGGKLPEQFDDEDHYLHKLIAQTM